MKEKKNRIEKKLHYILKYLVLGLPLILLILGCFRQNNAFMDIINDFINNITNTPINEWYSNIIHVFNIDTSNTLTNILIHYPLYIFYVFLIDLVCDIICFLPKVFHKWLNEVI